MQSLLSEDPQRIGDYTLLGRLGRGAMGTVFMARSPGGRQVAVKVVRPELADDPEFRERFRQEVETVRAVGGFWTAAVVDADPAAPRPWLATEYVPGPTLREVVKTHGPLAEPAVWRLAAGLAEALSAIHGAGLIHRDLKPSNVLLADDGPRVIDFGIAKAMAGVSLTATGMLVGTPGFLSPEQIEGVEIAPASDVFALGAVLTYAATGEGPFGSGEAPALIYRAVHTQPELDNLSPALRALVAACLRPNPAHRPTPARLLAEIGTPDAAPWRPERTVVAVRGADTARPPTRAYSQFRAAPVVRDLRPPAGNYADFRTSRLSALVWGVFSTSGALICAGIADNSSKAGDHGATLLFLVGTLVFGLSAVRLLWSLIRQRHRLVVSADGLAFGGGKRRRRQLAWSQLARVRVIEDKHHPWLVVWLTDAEASRANLGADYSSQHGGFRVFPVGHEHRKRRRKREVRELRAALAWYGKTVYDPSP